MKILRATIGSVLIAVATWALAGGQELPAPSPPWASSMPSPSQKHDNSVWTQQQKKMRMIARQKQLKEDAEKLLQLATDLKAQVDKSSADALSVDIIKNATKIEKLARSVKDLSKGDDGS